MSFARLPPSSITMYCTCGGAWDVDVIKVLLGASAVAERPSPSVARQTTRAERPIDSLKYRVVIFSEFFFLVELGLLTAIQFCAEPGTLLKRRFAQRPHFG